MKIPTVPGYRILQLLGRGGMGVVYKAERESDGLTVAVKTILPAVRADDTVVLPLAARRRFCGSCSTLTLSRFWTSARRRNCFILSWSTSRGPACTTSAGSTPPGTFPVGRAVRLICQVLEALAHAHSRGFVHRDIKPANVLVVGSGEDEQIKVGDFGLARAYHDSPLSGLTLSGGSAGTPQYMPPEQVLDFRSVKPTGDQYAAAAMLYYLLTGHALYPHANDVASFLQQRPDPGGPATRFQPASRPQPLTEVIDRALKRKPEERFERRSGSARPCFPIPACKQP